MLTELQPIRQRWEETHDALLQIIEQLPADRWQWQPAAGATTAAGIVQHIANSEKRYVEAIRALERGHYPRKAVTDLATARAALDEAARLARECFDQLAAADLKRVCAETWAPLGPRLDRPFDVLWFLEQIIRHQAYHLGQLNYLLLMCASKEEQEP